MYPSGRIGFSPRRGSGFSLPEKGTSIGPFGDKREAAQGLEDFVEFMSLAQPKTLSKLYAALAS